MRKFAMVAVFSLVASVANAQMGPAGPPGGFIPSSGGKLKVYAGMTETNEAPVGTSLTIVYVPSVSYQNNYSAPAISYVKIKDSGEADPGNMYYKTTFNLIGGLNGTYTPADRCKIRVIGEAYDANNVLVDSSAFESTIINWRKIDNATLMAGMVNKPLNPMGYTVNLKFDLLDTTSAQVGSARWKARIRYNWLGTVTPVQTYDINEQNCAYIDTTFTVSEQFLSVMYNNFENLELDTLDVSIDLYLASAPGDALVFTKTVRNKIKFTKNPNDGTWNASQISNSN